MSGLSSSPASTSSLLLNLEGVLTSTPAWFVFKDHYDRRIVIGMIAIVLGGIVLTWTGENNFSVAGLFMGFGVWLHLTEHHEKEDKC